MGSSVNRKGLRASRLTSIFAVGAISALIVLGLLSGCSSDSSSQSTESSTPEPQAQKTLEGKTLDIYCGAGMTDPFQEIADAFADETGCTMNVTFANAAQIQTQITTTEEGDFFIAGSEEELKPVQDFVSESTPLVKHIPVLVVPSENPKNVNGIADLASCERVLIGDPESTPVGKIAKKALTEEGLWDSLSSADVLTTTTTAPQIANALANGEGDAGIVWKENVNTDKTKIVEGSGMEKYIKTVPAALLTCSKDAEAAGEFSSFLQTDTAKQIWEKYGYELV